MRVFETYAALEKQRAEASPLHVKTAGEFLAETIALVMPPKGGVITLTEMIDDTPNWSLNFSAMGDGRVRLIVELIARLGTEHPIIDWSGEKIRSGSDRRTIHFRAR